MDRMYDIVHLDMLQIMISIKKYYSISRPMIPLKIEHRSKNLIQVHHKKKASTSPYNVNSLQE